MMKIYVRERTMGKEGGHTPRFRVVATEGGDLRFHADHVRKIDVETIAKDLGADIIYLPEHDQEVRKDKGRKVKSK